MEKYVAGDYQSTNLQLSQARKSSFELAFGAGIQVMEFYPKAREGPSKSFLVVSVFN